MPQTVAVMIVEMKSKRDDGCLYQSSLTGQPQA